MGIKRMRLAALLLLAMAVPASATFHLIKVVELFPGTPAAPGAHYVVLQMYASGQDELQGHALSVHDATGALVDSFVFPADVGNGNNQAKVLIATSQAASFFDVAPDLLMDADLLLAGGKVCFADTIDCVAWGSYESDDGSGGGYGSGIAMADATVGTPFNADGGLVPGRAVVRRLDIAGSATVLDAGDDTDDSANDFVFGLPAPRNNAGQLGQVPGSTCGNGALEGLEQCDDGNLSDTDACSSTCMAQEAPADAPASDFDGDGGSDVFWRHDNTGANTAWRSANASTQLSVVDVASPAWRVVGVADFDADGRADVFWRNAGNGANTVWRSADAGTRIPVPAVTNLAWQVVGTGDFDGDGRGDVVWRNASTGANTIWRSANAAAQLDVTDVSGLGWKIVSTGDFDGDGEDDLFWRESGSGKNTVWRSGNSSARITVPTVADRAWRVVGAGDFDGDGHDDAFWRNLRTGANTIWRSANPATQIGVTTVASQSWQVEQIADFDGDGRSDLFWRNGATGANTVWRSGNASTRLVVATVASTAWKVVP